MAIVKIEGKEITIPDDVVKAGDKAIRAVLAANGWPAVENAHIEIQGRQSPGAPAVVTASPRSTGKGGSDQCSQDQCEQFVKTLASAPEYINPAIALAAQVMRAEMEGDSEYLDRAARSGAVERAVEEGSREGKDLMRALAALGHCVPASSKTVPVGF